MDHSSAASAGVVAVVILIYGIVLIVAIAFTIWVYWRIFAKAGFNGALSLLNLVPGVGGLICMILLAFGRWPIEDQLAALQARGSGPTFPPPPPPGTSVIPT